MRKFSFTVTALCVLSACSPKVQTSNTKWPVVTDTIIHPSVKDPKVMDTVFVKSAIDTTLPEQIDTIMMPGQDPPYTPVTAIRKVGARKHGRKITFSSMDN